ncbi:ashwin [Acanthopagrus latus]|uniref:ashwin n=1 Tax=Acanthopagrus latus TaxID=8177 RepID=UPI00187C5C9D|nr:ashwin [Acanthopagrus latus]
MATSTGQDGQADGASKLDLLLHPELLSQDFMQLLLSEKRVSTRDCESRDQLTELYLRHVIPLPQRSLPNTRWGKRMEKSQGRQTPAHLLKSNSSNDHNRKRPLIVFDGSSSHSGPIKVKKPEGTTVPTGVTDRLKPPPVANLSNPIRKLSANTSSTSSPNHRSNDTDTNLKRGANSSESVTSPEVKKKIQHVTWP